MNTDASVKESMASINVNIWKIIAWIGAAVIILFSTACFFISRNTLSEGAVREPYSKVDPVATVGELTDGTELRQEFDVNSDCLTGMMVKFATYNNQAKGSIHLTLLNSSENILASTTLDASALADNTDWFFDFGDRVDVRNDRHLTLRIRAEGGQHQSSATLWAGMEQPGCSLYVNGTKYPNTIYMEPEGFKESNYVLWHWLTTGLLILSLLAFCFYQHMMAKNGKKTAFSEIVHVFDKYRFLLSQLVAGDFKNKYRRSYLGILWSLLNPLLMMIVMSVVFTHVFRFGSIPNYQVYLILGQVLFSFFSESTQMSIMTIVGSAPLIKKVYLPRYIFPLSKVVFSFINMAISFIAVFLVMAYYRVPITWNIVYLPMILADFFLFCLGIGFILSALMVFIRDTLHFYGIITTILGYLTPIFYSVEILPPILQTLLKLNPLFHYITAVRTILLYGQPISVRESVICLAFAILSLFIGIHFFQRKQKKFILYI